VLIFICVIQNYFQVKTELKVIGHMSDPNSTSSDILSDGPVKYILRPVLLALPTLTQNRSCRAANYCRTSDNVRLNLANVRAKVILIGHWSDHKKKVVTLYIFLLWQNTIANSLNLHFAIKFTRHSSILLNVAPEWLYILVSWLVYISCDVYMSDQI
jgi:hypothetical protein